MNQNQAAKTLGDWAYIAIAKPYKKILKHESKVLKDKNPEQLHQMRVGMRRLRSTISGFAPALNLSTSISEKKVAKIAKVLGKLRDIDVLQNTLVTEYQPNLPEIEQQNLGVFLKALKKQRKNAFKDVKRTLKSGQYLELKTGLEAWLESPVYHKKTKKLGFTKLALVEIQRVLPDLLLPQVSSFLMHPGWLVGIKVESGMIDFSNRKNLATISSSELDLIHDLRKNVKKTRYNMELFSRFYGNLYSDYLQQITNTQEVLGYLQDTTVLMNFLGSVSNNQTETYMPILIQFIKKNRLIKLQEWQDLQQYFLNQRRQQELRAVVQYPS